MSQPALAISLFFHILATVVWLGGLLMMTLLVIPELDRALAKHPTGHETLHGLRRRFGLAGNLALAALVVTGLLQMTADPHYDGLLNLDSAWSRVLLLKHGLIILMVLMSATLQYSIAPALERTTLLLRHGKGSDESWRRLRRREKTLSVLMTGLGLLILAASVGLAAI